MTLFGNIRTKRQRRHEEAARRFLSDPSAQNDGRPPIPADSVVELQHYGTIWRGASAVRVVLLGNRDAAMDFRLAFQPTGPDAAGIVTSPAHAARVIQCAKAAQKDLDDLKRLINRPAPSPAQGGAEPLSERDIEILRTFRLELVNGGVLCAVRRAPAESASGK